MSSRSRFLATFVFLAATAGSSTALAASWKSAGGCANFIGSGWMLGCDGPGRSGTVFYWNGSSWSRPALWGAPSVFWNLSVDLTGQAWLVSEDQHVYKAIGSKESGYVPRSGTSRSGARRAAPVTRSCSRTTSPTSRRSRESP